MLTLIFVICLIAAIVFFILSSKIDDGFCILGILFAAVTIASACWLFPIITTVATANTIDEKIVMYQEENANIEANINTLVEKYMDYEANVYSDLKQESLISLVSYFPELEADELVQKQIDIYYTNKEQLRLLREQQIDIAKERFLLYFGN